MKIVFSASLELDDVPPRTRFAAISGLVAAALVAIASLSGIALPATYARETPIWRAQGIGQDWANLLFAVPWLMASAGFVLHGSRPARLLLGGGLVYTAYSYVIYAFDVHFNGLFLVYCAALGTSVYGAIALASDFDDVQSWFDERVPRRAAAGFAMVCAVAFGTLWLSQIVPALLERATPVDIEASGLFTNPAHVLDLALILPALFGGGFMLWHRQSMGYAIVPILLGFTVLMGAALAGMATTLVLGQFMANGVIVVVFAVFVLIAAGLLTWMLHSTKSRPAARAIARLGAV